MLSRSVISQVARTCVRSNAVRCMSSVASSHNSAQQQQQQNSHHNHQHQQQHQQQQRSWSFRTGVTMGTVTAASWFLLTAAADDKKKTNWDEIRQEIAALLDNPNYDDGSYGPLLVRLAWHAAGTYDKNLKNGGSNGGLMRFSPEANWGANKGLAIARDLLEPIKKKHPEVSYGDLWTFAGAVAVEEMGGPKIPWKAARSDFADGSKSPPDGRLPDASQGQDHVRAIFYRMGFNDQEIVALLGAHALGRCHTDRSGYEGPWTRAPTTFSNEYYKLLLNENWTKRNWNGPVQFQNAAGDLMMTPGDMAILYDPAFKKYVEIYAADEQRFFNDFAAAFGKLLALGVPQ